MPTRSIHVESARLDPFLHDGDDIVARERVAASATNPSIDSVLLDESQLVREGVDSSEEKLSASRSADCAAIRRSTDTPLAPVSMGRLSHLLGRCLSLRCPNCGEGPVLAKSKLTVRERCSKCNFRFMRSDDNYFDGAMFCSLMIMEALFAFGLAASVILMWPDVPWDAITYIAVGGMVVLAVVMQPLGKVAWLFLDVMFRPIFAEECE
jgi:uncharacterized protein (DUF983 family)